MTRDIEGYYQEFVTIVARGRGRPAEEIEKLARGRVYSGTEAHRLGLVDHLGGFDTALDLVRERLGETRELDAALIKPPRVVPKPPELPRPFVWALEAARLDHVCELGALALSLDAGETVLAWSGLAGIG
jgi:ClpP class serine protease